MAMRAGHKGVTAPFGDNRRRPPPATPGRAPASRLLQVGQVLVGLLVDHVARVLDFRVELAARLVVSELLALLGNVLHDRVLAALAGLIALITLAALAEQVFGVVKETHRNAPLRVDAYRCSATPRGTMHTFVINISATAGLTLNPSHPVSAAGAGRSPLANGAMIAGPWVVRIDSG